MPRSFFWQVGNAIEKNTLQSLRSNVQRQCYHFRSMLDIQFSTLESLADHMGRQESLLTSDNLDLLHSAIRGGEFSRTMLITPDGTGYSSDDAVTHVGQRAYFQQALAGHRAVSDPLESSVDGSNKVVLAVPVRDHAHRVLGVLGGAYDLGSLSQFLYSGTGYSFIVTTEGSMVSIDPGISIEENSDFFSTIAVWRCTQATPWSRSGPISSPEQAATLFSPAAVISAIWSTSRPGWGTAG